MNLPFILKFSSISNLSDARYAAGMWADFIGFNFDANSSEYIDPNKAKTIMRWINGPSIVGEFGHQPKEWIKDFAQQLQFKVIQVPADYADLSLFEEDFKTIVYVNSNNQFPSLLKADILITNQVSLYQELKNNYQQPILLELTSFEEDATLLDGIAIVGETETIPGTRNQSAWTEFLEKYEDN